MSMTAQAVMAMAAQAGVPSIAWGLPGVGKTAYACALAQALDAHLEVVIASQHDPSDFGMPIITNGHVRRAPHEWALRADEAARKAPQAQPGAIILFDELSTAPPLSQAGVMRIIHERVIGDFVFAPNVSMLACANPPEMAAGGWELSPPMANRFLHLDWTVDAQAAIDGMLAGWPAPRIVRLPERWRAGVHAQRTLVASFWRARPQHVIAVPNDASKAGRAWPSPRTWDHVATMRAACEAVSATVDVELAIVGGLVGHGVGLEFHSWLRDLDLPDPEELLRKPESFRLPKRTDQQFAVLAAVGSAVIRRLDNPRWLAAWRVMELAGAQGAKDVACAAVKTLADTGWGRADLTMPREAVKMFKPLLVAAGFQA